MSLEMASISMSFDLDTSGLMSGANAFGSAFDQIDASARGMASDIDSVLDQIESNLKSTTTGTTMLSDGMGDVGVAAAKASGALRETGTAAAQTGAAMSTVDDASTQVAAAMAAIDNSANSAASGMLQTGTAADAAEAGIRSAGSAAERASQSIQQIDDAAAQASRGLNKGSTETERFGAAVMRLESQINTVGFGLAGFGGAITAGLGMAVAEFSSFEAALRNVNSIAGLTDEELSKLGDSIQDLATRVGKGPTELAEGLYDIQSSGFEAADALQILEKAAIAATAGLTDTGTAARAITAVLNAYKKSAAEAGDVSDVLFKVVDSGVITFEDLANNMGTVLPIAAALKVPIEQVAAAYAQLTLNGISATQAETAIAAVMRAAINPTTELSAAVTEYGYASAEAMIQSEGLIGFLNLLIEASGGTTEGLTKLLGTADATTGVLALMNDGGLALTGTIAEMSAAMQDGATTQAVFNEQADSTRFAVNEMGVAFDNAQITVGGLIAPLVRLGAEGITGVLNGFNALPGPVQAGVTALAGITGATTLAAGGMLLLIPKIVEFRQALQSLPVVARVVSAALSFMTGPWGIALAAIGVGIVALGAIWQRHSNDVKKAQAAYDEMLKAVQATDDVVSNLNLAGKFELARLVQEELDQARAVINGFEADMAEVDFFRNVDFFFDDNAPSFADGLTDFIGKNFGVAVANFANDPKYRDGLAGSLADIFNAIDPTVLADNFITADEFKSVISRATIDQLEALTPIMQQAAGDFFDQMEMTDEQRTAIETSMQNVLKLFENPNINTSALQSAWDAIWANFFATGDVNQLQADLDALFIGIQQGTATSAEGVDILAESFDGLSERIRKLDWQVDDLRLDGLNETADAIEHINTQLGKIDLTQFSETQANEFTAAWDRINAAIIDGKVNVDEITATIDVLNQMLADGKITPEQYSAAIVDIGNNLDFFAVEGEEAAAATSVLSAAFEAATGNAEDTSAAARNLGDALIGTAGGIAAANAEAFAFSQTLEGLGGGLTGAAAEAAQSQADALQAVNDATIAWLGNGDNILAFLNSYISESNTSAQASIDWAMAMNQTASAMESVLAIFGEIDALGQRSSQANSIAENLVGKPGEWAEIDEMLQRGEISLEQYNAALEAGYSIQQDNLQVQRWLNEIRADQLPLLAKQQSAYENQIEALTKLSAEEQQRALYLQSSAGQAAVATAYSTAYAASLGEIPEEVATELIANAAASDPILKQTLLDLGLINETDGVITVNFPDGPTVQDTITELTRSIDELIRVMGGVPPLHIDSNVKDVLADVTDLVGTGFMASIGVEDNASPTIGAVGNGLDALDGTEAEPTVSLDDNATPPATALGDALRALGESEEDAIVNLSGNAIDNATYLEQVLANLDGGTTTHTIEIKQIGGSFLDAAGRAAEGAQQPEQPQPDRGQQSGFGMQGPPPIVMPAIDTTLFDASVVALGATYQQLLTATNATFVVAIPANITAGMLAGSSSIYGEITVWQLHFGANLQPILTVVNAVFVTAIPLNILTGMQLGSTNISTEAGTWSGLIDAVAPAMGAAGLNSGSVGGYGAANGIASAEGQISSNVGVWPGIIDGIAGAMGSNGFNAGASAGYGVANGIASAEGAAVAAATSLANAVNAALNAVIQPGSPSKVTTKLGKTIPAGLVVGQLSGEQDVYNAAATLGAAAESGLNNYLRHIQTDGDWLNDALLSLPKGDEWTAAMRAVWGDSRTREALKSYMEGVIGDGDWNNDMITHLPERLRDTFAEWGEYIARGLEDAADIANKAAWDASPSNPRNQSKGKWYDPRAGGNQGGSPLEPEPGNGGNMPNPPTPSPPDEDAWKKEIVGGLTGALTDAMKNAGLEFDKSAGSIFSKEEWESGMRLKDLFTGRTRVSDTGFLLGNGKYLEEYLGGLLPDEATAPYPPGTTPPDPTTPPKPGTGPLQPEYGKVGPKRNPDRPNTGGPTGYGSRTEIHYHQEDQRTTMYTPEPERFTEMLVKARNGDTAFRAARNVGTNRTLAHGVRSTPGRY